MTTTESVVELDQEKSSPACWNFPFNQTLLDFFSYFFIIFSVFLIDTPRTKVLHEHHRSSTKTCWEINGKDSISIIFI